MAAAAKAAIHGVPGSGHVVHVAGVGGEVLRALRGVKQAHARGAARHQKGLRRALPQQRFGGGDQGRVVFHRLAGRVPDLRQVGGQHGGAAVAGEVACLGIDENRHVDGLCLGEEGRQQVGRADALVVIGADEAVHFGQDGFGACHHLSNQRIRQRQSAFVVQTHKLLMPGDEARLFGGRAPGVLHQQVVGDALRPQLRPHVPPGSVVPNHARQAHLATQGAQVGRHVCRAAQDVALLGAL